MIEKYNQVIWMDGKFVKSDKATTHVMSHSLHYAGSVFEGIKSYAVGEQQIIFRLKDHVTRLFDSARRYKWEIPYSQEQVTEAIIELVNRNRGTDLYIRPLFYMGLGYDTIEITDQLEKHLIISCWQLNKNDYEYELGISPYMRPPSNVLDMESKCSANYVNSIRIRTEAKERGYHDAISCDINGHVAEISTANIFFSKNNIIYTPSTDCSILNGITRQSVIDLAQDLGYQVIEGKFTTEQLLNAENVFVTGTAAEIKNVKSLETTIYSKNQIFIQLNELFYQVLNLQNDNYQHWITYVK